jgi:hypothetical protein
MNKKASIGAELKLDRRGFSKELAAAASDARQQVSQMGNISGNFSGMRSGLAQVGKSYGHLRSVVTDFVNVARAPVTAEVDFEDWTDYLTAIEGSSESAEESLRTLLATTRDQALEMGPLVEAQGRLVSLGYSAEQSRDMIKELANAAEFSGADGNAAITGIVGTLEKVTEKGEASVKMLMSFGTALPVLRDILDMQFGVKTAADLETLNLTSEEVFSGLLTGLKSVQTATASTNETLQNAEHWTMAMMGAPEAVVPPPSPLRTPAAPESEAARDARLGGLRTRSARDKEAKALAEGAGARQSSAEDLELATLRARGKNKQADALQTKIEERRSIEKFQAEGYDTATAAAMAGQQTQNKEDTAYFEKTGRRRIKGAKSQTGFTGLDGAFDNSVVNAATFDGRDYERSQEKMSKPISKQGKGDTRFSQTGTNNVGIGSQVSEGIAKLNQEMRAMHATLKNQNPSVSSKTAPQQ